MAKSTPSVTTIVHGTPTHSPPEDAGPARLLLLALRSRCVASASAQLVPSFASAAAKSSAPTRAFPTSTSHPALSWRMTYSQFLRAFMRPVITRATFAPTRGMRTAPPRPPTSTARAPSCARSSYLPRAGLISVTPPTRAVHSGSSASRVLASGFPFVAPPSTSASAAATARASRTAHARTAAPWAEASRSARRRHSPACSTCARAGDRRSRTRARPRGATSARRQPTPPRQLARARTRSLSLPPGSHARAYLHHRHHARGAAPPHRHPLDPGERRGEPRGAPQARAPARRPARARGRPSARRRRARGRRGRWERSGAARPRGGWRVAGVRRVAGVWRVPPASAIFRGGEFEIRTRAHTHTHTHTRTHAHAHTHVDAHAHTHPKAPHAPEGATRTRTRTRRRTRTYAHTHTHAYRRTSARTRARTHTHTHTHTLTPAHPVTPHRARSRTALLFCFLLPLLAHDP